MRSRADAARASTTYVFEGRRFDPRRSVIERGGREIRLAPKTSDLLELLLRHPGQVLARRDIIARLWPDVVVGDDALSFQLTTLRKALEDVAHLIETVPRRGYVWIGRSDTGEVDATAGAEVSRGDRLVGREADLSRMTRHLAAAAAGECQVLLLLGDEGVGKSRLLAELGREAEARGMATLRGRFVEADRGLPYQGFCESLLEHFQRGRPAAGTTSGGWADLAPALVALFPVLREVEDLRRAPSEAGRPSFPRDRAETFEVLARAVLRLSAAGPLVLLLEDLHADEDSVDVLEYIAHRLRPAPLVLAGTARRSDLHRAHRFWRLAEAFRGERRFRLLKVLPFSLEECRAFLCSWAGDVDPPERAVNALFEATGGNPHLIRELILSAEDEDGSEGGDTRTVLHRVEHVLAREHFPATIRQAAERRIARLPQAWRSVLAAASVLGHSFSYDALVALCPDVPDVDPAIEACLERGLLAEDRTGGATILRFPTRSHRDAVYTTLSHRRGRELHRRAAEALEGRYRGGAPGVLAELVRHYARAEVASKVIEYGIELARQHLALHAGEEALRAAQGVLHFLDEGSAAEEGPRAEAHRLLGHAYRVLGQFDLAFLELETSARSAEARGDLAAASATLATAVDVAWEARRITEMKALLARGLALASRASEEGSRRRLLVHAATLDALRGDYEAAQEQWREIESLSPPRETSPPVEGGTVTAALASPVMATHPADIRLADEAEVLGNLFETLVTTDRSGHPVPHLCRRWDAERGGAEFLFHLRESRLHDGRPLSAGDVRRSFEEGIRRGRHSPPGGFSLIDGMEAFASGTTDHLGGIDVPAAGVVRIRLRDRLPIYPLLLTDVRTAIAVPSVEGGEAFVGTGPFRLRSKGDVLVLERHAGYAGRAALLEALAFTTIARSSDRAQAFEAGGVDLVGDLPEALVDRLLLCPDRPRVVETRKRSTTFILFNRGTPIGGDPDVREALLGVLHPHQLVRAEIGRLAEPAEGLFPPPLLGFEAGLRPRILSMAEARRRLGVRRGPPLALRAAVHPVFQDRYRGLIEQVALLWKEAGVDLRLETPDMPAFLRSTGEASDVDVLIGRWIAEYDDADSFASLFDSRGGRFREYAAGLDLDLLVTHARQETEPRARHELYRRINRRLTETSTLLPLFHEVDVRVARRSLRGLVERGAPLPGYAGLWRAPASAPGRAPRRAATVEVPMTSALDSLDPSLLFTVEQGEVIPTIFDTLTHVTEGARVVPWLASGFRAEEGSRRFRFRLRDDVRFHDGRRLSSRDVRFTFERLLANPASRSRFLLSPVRAAQRILDGEASDLAGFQIESASEFVLELERPLSFFPAILAHYATAIVPEGTASFAADPGGPVGTGPYRVAHFEKGERLELLANPDYWRPGLPRNGGLSFRFRVPAGEAVAGFRSGRFSVLSALPPSELEALRSQPPPGAVRQERLEVATHYLVFNARRGPFSNEALRHRVRGALDVAGLVRRHLGSGAVPALTLVPPGLIGHDPPRPAPVSAAAPGARLGECLALVNPVYDGRYAGFADALLSALGEAGVPVRRGGGSKEAYHDALRAGDADFVLTRWVADYPDADNFYYLLLHSEHGIVGRFCGCPEVDELLEQGRTESDLNVRHRTYRRIEAVLAERAFLVPLFHPQNTYFLRPELEDLDLAYFAPFLNYEQLRFRDDLSSS